VTIGRLVSRGKLRRVDAPQGMVQKPLRSQRLGSLPSFGREARRVGTSGVREGLRVFGYGGQ